MLDLAGFDAKASVNYIGGTSLGVVVVSENGKVATIAVGSNTTHWTKPVSDGHGGILIEDPVQNDAAPNANTSHAWSTAGADCFCSGPIRREHGVRRRPQAGMAGARPSG